MSEIWQVKIETMDDHIAVRPSNGATRVVGETRRVKKPNWLERQLGITMEIKLDRAVTKCQKYCDWRNNSRCDMEEMTNLYSGKNQSDVYGR